MAHVILPTGKCFDDALEWIIERIQQRPELAHGGRLRLVHGIAMMPADQPNAGELFAHAWVEEAGECYSYGMLQVDGQPGGVRVQIREPRAEFYARLRIKLTSRYTPWQAHCANARTRSYGPWEPGYLRYVKGATP